jgi:hypothetical protein
MVIGFGMVDSSRLQKLATYKCEYLPLFGLEDIFTAACKVDIKRVPQIL